MRTKLSAFQLQSPLARIRGRQRRRLQDHGHLKFEILDIRFLRLVSRADDQYLSEDPDNNCVLILCSLVFDNNQCGGAATGSVVPYIQKQARAYNLHALLWILFHPYIEHSVMSFSHQCMDTNRHHLLKPC